MKTDEILKSINEAKKELGKIYDVNIEKVKKELEEVAIPNFEKLTKKLNETVAQVFGWNADYHFVERSHIDVLDNYQTYNIVEVKQIKVLIPEESVDKTDSFIVLAPKREFGIREPNMMDIIYLRNRLYMVDSVYKREDTDSYELTISKYQQYSVLKGL